MSVPERLNYVCVAKISDQAAYFYHERNHELYGILRLRNLSTFGKGSTAVYDRSKYSRHADYNNRRLILCSHNWMKLHLCC